jgi:hypothetical protein
MRIVALVGALVACVHAGIWALAREQAAAPNFTGQIASMSYTPFDGSAHPDSGTRTSPSQIRADLKAIAPYTRMVRTYSSTGGSELVPEIANSPPPGRRAVGHRRGDEPPGVRAVGVHHVELRRPAVARAPEQQPRPVG